VVERLYTVRQTAELLGTTPEEVRGWIEAGRLPAEEAAGSLLVSERGLVRFLAACGIDLGAILKKIEAEWAEEDEADRSAWAEAPPGATPAAKDQRPASPPPPAFAPPTASAPQAPPPTPTTSVNAAAAPAAASCAESSGPIIETPLGTDAASRLAEAILRDALARGAEAVYLEPVPGSLTLKLVVGGRVREKPRFASRLPKGLGPRLLERLRAMARTESEADAPAADFTVRLNGRPHRFLLADRPTEAGTGLAIYPVPEAPP